MTTFSCQPVPRRQKKRIRRREYTGEGFLSNFFTEFTFSSNNTRLERRLCRTRRTHSFLRRRSCHHRTRKTVDESHHHTKRVEHPVFYILNASARRTYPRAASRKRSRKSLLLSYHFYRSRRALGKGRLL